MSLNLVILEPSSRKNNYQSWKEHVKIIETVKFEGSKFKTREYMNFQK